MMISLLFRDDAQNAAATGPPTRQECRRLSAVAADPRLATCDDVELLVRAHGVPETKVWAVVDRLARGRVDPTLAWCWALDHDGGELAELCGTSMGDRQVVAHMILGPAHPHARRPLGSSELTTSPLATGH